MKYKTYWLAGLLAPMLVLSTPAEAVESTIVNGSSHTLFVDKGAVFAMGSNNFGEVKAETATTYVNNILTPVQYEGLLNVKSVAAGLERSAALHADGTVSIWGRKDERTLATFQLAKTLPQNTGATRLATVGSGPVTDIAFSNAALYYVLGGAVYKYTYAPAPTVAVQLPANAVAKSIAAGGGHLLVLFQDGSVGSTGANTYGQLGLGAGTFVPDVVTKVEGISNIVDIAAGLETSFAKTSDGMVYGFGRNDSNQMGDGTVTNYFYPTPIPSIQGVKKIMGGYSSTVALMDDGRLLVAGWHNYVSSTGAGYNTTKTWKVLGDVPRMQNISTGWGSAYLLTNDAPGTIHGWSMNRNGQLGVGSTYPEHHTLVTAVFTPYEPPFEALPVQPEVVAVKEPEVQPIPAPTPIPEPVDTAIALPFLDPTNDAPVVKPEPAAAPTVVDTVVEVVTKVVDAVVDIVTTVMDAVVDLVAPAHAPVVVQGPASELTPVAIPPAPILDAVVVNGPGSDDRAPLSGNKCNNGWGNGDQCASGNSLMHNNAENAQNAKANGKATTPAPVVVAVAKKK